MYYRLSVSQICAMEDALVITAARIRQILAYSSLIERLRGAFAEFPKFAVPPTVRHAIVASGSHGEGEEEEGALTPSLLLMTAWGTGSECPYVLVKSVTVFPENGAKSLPAVAGTYVLSSLETGNPCCLCYLVSGFTVANLGFQFLSFR